MSAQGSRDTTKKLFDIELPEPIAKLARKVEGVSGKAIAQERIDGAEMAPMVGYFDDHGVPKLVLSQGATPTLADITVELVRLDFRKARFEKNMPYAEMRHEANRRLCRRLYRIVEHEVVLPEAEALGVRARSCVLERMKAVFEEPLRGGRYRAGEADPGRMREGALDALELVLAENDSSASERHIQAIAEVDQDIARSLGMLYKVIENHRPFEGDDRVRAAYYLAVPFLFDARRPTQPANRVH